MFDHGGDNVTGRNGVDPDAVLAPLGGEVTAKLEDTSLGGIVCRADKPFVGNGTGHAGNHGHRPAIAKAKHLLGNGLRRHEDAGDVDFKHGVGVHSGIVKSRSFLLHTGATKEAVKTALGIADTSNDLIEPGNIAEVDWGVVQLSTKLNPGALLYAGKLGRGFGQTVKGVDCRYG